MSECPKNATPINCGLLAAQRLVSEQLVVIDNIGMRTPGKAELLVDRRGASALEILQFRRQYEKHLAHDFAEFGCLACGRLVEIEDDGGDLSTRLVETDS